MLLDLLYIYIYGIANMLDYHTHVLRAGSNVRLRNFKDKATSSKCNDEQRNMTRVSLGDRHRWQNLNTSYSSSMTKNLRHYVRPLHC